MSGGQIARAAETPAQTASLPQTNAIAYVSRARTKAGSGSPTDTSARKCAADRGYRVTEDYRWQEFSTAK
jgi:hypothetical protein